MKGIPVVLNTRNDHDYIRTNNSHGWQAAWGKLLDGRFCVHDNELVEDTNCQLYRLGFTVKEVADAVGAKGLTNREVEWYESQPDRYQLIDGVYVEVDGWKERYFQQNRIEVLESKLSEIDAALATLQAGTFKHDGHNYYIDPLTITGQVVVLSMLPDTYTRTWKTADKAADGVSNIEVVLNKQGLLSMAAACMAAFGDNWDKADAAKNAVKSLYRSGGDIAAFVVDLG